MTFALTQFAYVVILYGLLAALPYYLLCHRQGVFERYRLKGKQDWQVTKKEIRNTLQSLLVLFAVLLGMGLLLDEGLLRFRSAAELSVLGLIGHAVLIVLVQDAYFYWTHRLQHQNRFLFRFHRHHHYSPDTTSLSIFSFHPVEAIIQFSFFILYPLAVPVPLEILQFKFAYMVLLNSAGHLPYEFYPKALLQRPFMRFCSSATQHHNHHKAYHYNFGLYYLWWDKWFGTHYEESMDSTQRSKHSRASFGSVVNEG